MVCGHDRSLGGYAPPLSPAMLSSAGQPHTGAAMLLLKLPISDVGEVPRNRRRRRHHGADQMRAPAAPLPPLKIAVAGRSAAFSRLQNIRIHSQAHRAPGLAPLKPRI